MIVHLYTYTKVHISDKPFWLWLWWGKRGHGPPKQGRGGEDAAEARQGSARGEGARRGRGSPGASASGDGALKKSHDIFFGQPREPRHHRRDAVAVRREKKLLLLRRQRRHHQGQHQRSAVGQTHSARTRDLRQDGDVAFEGRRLEKRAGVRPRAEVGQLEDDP